MFLNFPAGRNGGNRIIFTVLREGMQNIEGGYAAAGRSDRRIFPYLQWK
ncbi:hypothetical protein ASZ90_010255 [hydrocarbon metagenome]|uniref:Uncharacterized protein n=1 Tax=hydrocarbon metagenome TaxID=938273 RepID=A0A0W8FGM5_9ZZZZ